MQKLSDMKPEALIAWREKRGWTMEQAAKELDIRLERWAEWEAGTRPISLMVAELTTMYDDEGQEH